MSRILQAAVIGFALWLSGAVFAPASAEGTGWLVAVPTWHALAAALAAAGLLIAWLPPRNPAALLPLAGVLLPWMPFVDAGLVYAGPLVVLIWAAVLVLGWGDLAARHIGACRCATSATHATIAACLIALASTAAVAWRVAPMRPGGDEPHYLIMTQSLMKDGDLRIENNHAQRDFAAYTDVEINPQYLTRGQDGQIYPIHAPGLPAMVIPAFAAAGYAGVVVFLLVVMAGASALVWRLAWMASGDIAAAWFGWAVVASSCMWVFQSFLVFPEALGGAAVAAGLWLVLRLDRGARPGPLALAGVGLALALLPWLHTRFAVLAAGLGLMAVLRLLPLGIRAVAIFLAAPVAAAAAWFAFFYAVYGTPDPIAPWGGTAGSSLGWIPTGLAGALFDQQFGILPYAPVLAAGFAGLLAGTGDGWRRATRLQVLLLLIVPYLLATTSYAMWWGGMSVPGRLFTALLPLLAPAAAVLWRATQNGAARAGLTAALAWTIFATASLAFVERGALAWNVRQHKAGLWFEWLVPLMRWTDSLPAFFRADDTLGRESLPLPPFYGATAIWLAALVIAVAAAAFAVRRMGRARWRGMSSDGVAPSLAVTMLILAVPAATVLSLRAQGADASAPARAQIAFLNRLASGNAQVLDLGRRRVVGPAEHLSAMRLSGAPGAAFGIGPVPEGTYRLSATPGGPGEPEGVVLVGRSQFPIATLGGAPVDLALPVGVTWLEVRGADGRRVTLEPVEIRPAGSRRPALRASRYGAATVFFTDNRVYAERDGFWVRGARHADVALQGDAGVAGVTLEIRNGPVENYLVVTGAAQPVAVDLAPGQVIPVPVAFDARGGARLRIDSRAGFVPAEVDAGNRDFRSLGVYVSVN